MTSAKDNCKWEDEHISTMLASFKANKPSMGDGGNPTSTVFMAALKAVNEAHQATQNKEKTKKSLKDKWRAVSPLFITYHISN